MKRVLKRLTGAPVGPIPPGAWLSVVAGVVVLLGLGALRGPVSALVGAQAADDRVVGNEVDAGGPGSQDLRPGGPLLTGVPAGEAWHLFELDEASLRLRLRALTAGDDGPCPEDPAAETEGAELRASSRLTAWPRNGDTGDRFCRPATGGPDGTAGGPGGAGR